MAKREKYVSAPDTRAEKTLSKASRELHDHLMTTAVGNGHGHAVGSVSGNVAPDNHASMQKGSFVPQRVFSGPGQVSQGGFQQGGASGGADYQTTNEGSVGDCDSGNPTGY